MILNKNISVQMLRITRENVHLGILKIRFKLRNSSTFATIVKHFANSSERDSFYYFHCCMIDFFIGVVFYDRRFRQLSLFWKSLNPANSASDNYPIWELHNSNLSSSLRGSRMTYYGIAHLPLVDRASPLSGSRITHYGIAHDPLWDRA